VFGIRQESTRFIETRSVTFNNHSAALPDLVALLRKDSDRDGIFSVCTRGFFSLMSSSAAALALLPSA